LARESDSGATPTDELAADVMVTGGVFCAKADANATIRIIDVRSIAKLPCDWMHRVGKGYAGICETKWLSQSL
jgi:hypothetical protein